MMDEVTSLRRATGAMRCLSCGKCTAVCPLAGDGSISSRVLAGQEWDPAEPSHSALVERCLTCAACEAYCPEGIHFTDMVRGLRGLVPAPLCESCPHGGLFQSLARSMGGAAGLQRQGDWLGPDLQVAEEGETALFVGCLPFFDAYFGEDLEVRPLEIARSAVRLLNRAGVRPVIVTEERCCGHDLLWQGDRESFRGLAEANAAAFSARGIKHIVTACAECCRTWRLDYPEAVPGYRPRVEHVSEFLAPRVEAGDIRFVADGSGPVTFQDPCRLGRHLGVFEPPRQVLAALPGTDLVEMRRADRQALCCGTSGFIRCDAASRRLQSDRLQEAAATGAATLVTTCPKCLIHFSCAQAENRARGRKEWPIAIEDLTVLAAGRLAEDAEADKRQCSKPERKAGEAR